MLRNNRRLSANQRADFSVASFFLKQAATKSKTKKVCGKWLFFIIFFNQQANFQSFPINSRDIFSFSDRKGTGERVN